VQAVFSGLRPLVKGNASSTAALSRDHYIEVSESGLISITGGKWTTYRKMAEDAVNTAIQHSGLEQRPCITAELQIHGAMEVPNYSDHGYYYGTDWVKIQNLMKEQAEWAETIHPILPYTKAEIIWAVREEMCMTVEDALSRRTRALLLNAGAAITAATGVAHLIAKEKNYDRQWEQEQIDQFCSIAANYLAK
jgi:glycerol-3-phosphate dehydrogenase